MARKTFSFAVTIEAPPKNVFAVLCDVERWPEWTSTMSTVQRLESGPLGLGSSARVRQPKLRPAVWQVTEFEGQRNFTWSTRSPGLRMTAGHLIAATAQGTRVTLSFELSGFIAPLAAKIYGGLIRRYIAIEAQGLKARSEPAARRSLDADAADPGRR